MAAAATSRAIMTSLVSAASLWGGYDDALLTAADAAGVDESVTVSLEDFAGLHAVVARVHFRFLGGSMGRVHGRRVAKGIDEAIRRGVPFIVITASGGARTQEGHAALMQMGTTVAAMNRARKAGIPTIAWFRNPTMGGVHASYGAAADLVLSERGAAIGFAGPRVVTAFTGEDVDSSSHNAEAYFAAGLIDAIAPEAASARRLLEEWVAVVHPGRRASAPAPHVPESSVSVTGWQAVLQARSPRPSARDIISTIAPAHVELRGDRAGEDDACMVAAIARIDGRRVMILGTDRNAPGAGGRVGAPAAAGFRKAARAIRLAVRWGIPIVTLVDTRGADPSPSSDRRGLAAAISDTLSALLDADVPTMAIVTGEGGSGGAFALAAADRLVMQDDAVFEVIAPEGAAAILLRDPERAEEIAAHMGLGAAELRRAGYSNATLPGPTTHGEESATRALRSAVSSFLCDASWKRVTPADRAARFDLQREKENIQ